MPNALEVLVDHLVKLDGEDKELQKSIATTQRRLAELQTRRRDIAEEAALFNADIDRLRKKP